MRLSCVAAIAAAGLVCTEALHAQDKKEDDPPRITAVAPLRLVPGATSTLHVRGISLGEGTTLRISGGGPPLIVEIQERKSADVPNGLDKKLVGDTEIKAKVTVPQDVAPGPVQIVAITSKGTTAPLSIQVATSVLLVEEKDPNDGFATAQELPSGQTVHGGIKADKDIDVFKFRGTAKQRIQAEVRASRAGSLLDPVLTLFDERGRVLAGSDDLEENRDASLTAQIPADGLYFLSLGDASDRGSSWHNYELSLREAP